MANSWSIPWWTKYLRQSGTTKMQFKIGDKVRWTDPDDDICSCDGEIVEIYSEDDYPIILVYNAEKSFIEVYADELTKLA